MGLGKSATSKPLSSVPKLGNQLISGRAEMLQVVYQGHDPLPGLGVQAEDFLATPTYSGKENRFSWERKAEVGPQAAPNLRVTKIGTSLFYFSIKFSTWQWLPCKDSDFTFIAQMELSCMSVGVNNQRHHLSMVPHATFLSVPLLLIAPVDRK